MNNEIAYNYLIQIASINGDLKKVKELVEKGANIHAIDDLAFRMTSENGHLEVVQYLVEKGANIHARDDRALIWAWSFTSRTVFS